MSGNNSNTGGQQQLEGSQTLSLEEIPAVLQLRAAGTNQAQLQRQTSRSQKPSVRWESDVIDNENMNKKKTKICCIFHPQQEFDDEDIECYSDHEHSSTSSSSSSSESESEKNLGFDERRERRVARRHRKLQQNKSKSPNAYEVQPDYTQERPKQHQHQR